MVHVQYIEEHLLKILYSAGEKLNTRNIGGIGEERAIRYLKNNEFKIVKQNYRCKVGEIDIIALKDNILRFIEVKYRKDESYGCPYEAVTGKKQNKIFKVSSWFLNENRQFENIQCSFDVISITDHRIEYIFNCFGAM